MKFTRVDLILLCMVLFWGGNISIIKVALKHFNPVVFNCLRFLIASTTMVIVYRRVFDDPVDRKELLNLLILGVLGNTIYQFLFIYGVKYTYVSHTSILLGTTPIFTAMVSSWTGLEPVHRKSWFAIVLSFLGVVLIVFGGANGFKGGLHWNVGDVFVLMCSFVWSIYTTFSKRVIGQYSARHYIVYTVMFGTLFMIPLSISSLRQQDWGSLGAYDWGAVLYSAFLALVFGYSAWYYGVQKIGSTRTAVYSNLTPVAGMAIGMIFLGERFSPTQWLGVAVIVLGLILMRRFGRIRETVPDERVCEASPTK